MLSTFTPKSPRFHVTIDVSSPSEAVSPPKAAFVRGSPPSSTGPLSFWLAALASLFFAGGVNYNEASVPAGIFFVQLCQWSSNFSKGPRCRGSLPSDCRASLSSLLVHAEFLLVSCHGVREKMPARTSRWWVRSRRVSSQQTLSTGPSVPHRHPLVLPRVCGPDEAAEYN